MVWGSPRTSHSAHTFKVVEQFVFELPTLVVMFTCRETKSGDKLIVYLLSSGTGSLVSCRISLCISSEMINNQQYIFISTLALFQMKEIKDTSSKGADITILCNGALVVVFGFFCFDTSALALDKLFNIIIHNL